ncbi:hypothetical protein, partial [Aquisphaera insulae]|uniref:hypothetical protein n=1 Tax=Aquisphaera insulae TaxID=2712864 RepID=UPI0013EDF6CA
MKRFVLPCVCMFLWGVAPASADLVLKTELVSSTATESVYGVSLIGAVDLATYNVEVVLQAAGLTDAAVQVAAWTPGYVFPDASNFFAGVNAAGGEVRVTLSDFTDPGVDTVEGVNAHLALITIDTTALTSPVGLGFDPETLVLATPAGAPIAGFEELKASLAIPEPSSLVLSALGGLGLLAAARGR